MSTVGILGPTWLHLTIYHECFVVFDLGTSLCGSLANTRYFFHLTMILCLHCNSSSLLPISSSTWFSFKMDCLNKMVDLSCNRHACTALETLLLQRPPGRHRYAVSTNATLLSTLQRNACYLDAMFWWKRPRGAKSRKSARSRDLLVFRDSAPLRQAKEGLGDDNRGKDLRFLFWQLANSTARMWVAGCCCGLRNQRSPHNGVVGTWWVLWKEQ